MRARKPDEATAAKKGDPPFRVCLLWRHPLVASSFRASVDPERFDVTDVRLTEPTAVDTDAAYETDIPLVVVESAVEREMGVCARAWTP